MTEVQASQTTTNTPEETRALAASLAPRLPRGSILALVGNLGAGKTCFVQGLAEGLGMTEPVTSPTYTLIQEYDPVGDGPMLVHADLYRIGDGAGPQGLGLDDYLFDFDGIVAIEWPERAPGLLPRAAWWITFERSEDPDRPDERRITITPPGSTSPESTPPAASSEHP